MFEDSFAERKQNRPSGRDRALGLVITLLVHAGLGLLVYQYRFTVKILPFSKDAVRTVVIVPPLKVAVPKVVGGRGLAEVPGEPPGGPSGPAGAPAAKARQVPEAPAAELGRLDAAGPPAGAGAALPPPGAGAAIPSLSSRFQQSIAIHGKSGLTLSLAPPGTPPGPPGIIGGAPMPDFSKFSRGAYKGGVGGYGTGGRGGGTGGTGAGGGGSQRVGMSIPLKGYDLLPWATAVIDKIQLAWALPAVPEVPEGAKISMIVVIKKSGDLDSIEILEGTSVELLDRAALDALRTALPFPALPADFPGDLLEITFEFVYDD